MPKVSLITGADFLDERGMLSFFNTFDMSRIKRMYQIAPANTKIIRAWQGHKIEQKWFYCTHGGFIINLVQVDNFERPNTKLPPIQHLLSESEPEVLHITGGYVSGIKATAANSKLLVFSDVLLGASKADDYRFDLDFWKAEWRV